MRRTGRGKREVVCRGDFRIARVRWEADRRQLQDYVRSEFRHVGTNGLPLGIQLRLEGWIELRRNAGPLAGTHRRRLTTARV